MSTYGRQVLGSLGRDLQVSADGRPDAKPGGITLDWATVAAAGSDTTLGDDNVILAGQKGLRYGQILTQITASGKFGPYDPAASDGRQTLTRGACYILNRTVFQNVPFGVGSMASDNPAVIEGGQVWKARLLITSGTHSLAAGPTVAEFEAAFPRIEYAQ